jgi:hypothetical protein
MSQARNRSGALVAATALSVLASVGLTGLPAVSAATGAPAFTLPPATFLFTPPTSVTTSTGVKIKASVTARVTSIGSDSITNISVLTARGTVETHNWDFGELPGTPFTANESAGTASVTTGTDLGAFGSVTLTAKSAGAAKTTHCNGTTTTVHPVTVTGNIAFNTRSTGSKSWGAIGGSSAKFRFTHSLLTTSNAASITGGCAATPCPSNGIVYFGFNEAQPSDPGIVGEKDGRNTILSISRTLDLSAGVTREDSVIGRTKSLTAKHTAAGESVAVKPTSPDITGSAILSQAKKPSTTTCKKTTIADYAHAKLTSKKLAGREQIFGALKVPSSSKGSEFEVAKRK